MRFAVGQDCHDALEVARLRRCREILSGLEEDAHLVGGFAALFERVGGAAVIGYRRGQPRNALLSKRLEGRSGGDRAFDDDRWTVGLGLQDDAQSVGKRELDRRQRASLCGRRLYSLGDPLRFDDRAIWNAFGEIVAGLGSALLRVAFRRTVVGTEVADDGRPTQVFARG